MSECRFGCGPAVARFALDQGCWCYPDDREQDLCAQHIVRATPLGGMVLVRAYMPAHPLAAHPHCSCSTYRCCICGRVKP